MATVEPETGGIEREVGSPVHLLGPGGRRMRQEAINTTLPGEALVPERGTDSLVERAETGSLLPSAQHAFPRAPQGPANFWLGFLGRLVLCEVS